MIYGYTPLATINLHDVATVEIFQTIDDTYLLQWDDSVANEWKETYNTLSAALTRAATLAACGESGWDKSFTTTEPAMFEKKASYFLQNEIL
jgi:sigma54-dependent transcription regulator